MKKIMMVILLLMSATCYAQYNDDTASKKKNKIKLAENILDSLPTKDGKVFYSEIIIADSIPKDELYSRAKKWLIAESSKVKDEKTPNVIQFEDKENGELIGNLYYENLFTQFNSLQDGLMRVNVNIKVKDNKCKLELTEFGMRQRKMEFLDKRMYGEEFPIEIIAKSANDDMKRFLCKIPDRIHDKIDSFKKEIQKPKDDW